MTRTVPNKGYGGIYGTEAAGKSPDDVRGQRATKAANDFANAEKSAGTEAPNIKDNTTSSSTDVAENGAQGHSPNYSEPKSGGVSGAAAVAAKATPMGRIACAFRGNGNGGGSKTPLIAIGSLTGIIAIIMMTISSVLPIHLINNFADLRNTMGTEMNLRGTKMIKHLFNAPKNEAESLFSKRNKMSNRKINQVNTGLEEQGMKFVVDGDKMAIKVASVADLDADGNINWDNVTTKISTEAEFTAKFNDDVNFRNAFNKGAKTMTGKNAGWFNTRLAEFLNSNRLTRALFANFIAEKGDSAVAAARKKIANQTDALKTDVQSMSGKVATDADGNETGDLDADGSSINKTPSQVSARRAQIASEIKAKADALSKGGSWVAAGVALTCGVALAVSAVSLVYAYQQAMEGLAVVADWFSAGQMPLAGEGNDSYHGLGSALTEASVTTAVDDNGDSIELHNGAKVSAVESTGLQQILVGATIQGGDLSAAKYNMEKAINYADLGIGGVGVCTTALAGAALFGAVVFALEAVAAFFHRRSIFACYGWVGGCR